MKVAYIFFGQVKNFNDRQFDAFQKNVQAQLSGHDVDYFLCTSRKIKYHNPRQEASEGGACIIDYQSIERYFNFKSIFYDEIERRDNSEIDDLAAHLVNNFGEAWGEDSLVSTQNSLRQIYSLEYFYNQFIKCGFEYDAFVLSRSDLYHTHLLNVECFDEECDIAVPYFDGYPQIDYGWFGGINDRFAVIKNNDALKTYCTRYSRIKNQPQFYHAEKYLMNCIKQDNLIVKKIHKFEFRLFRANGSITDLIGIYPDENMNYNLKNVSKSFFINLDRRKDRLAHILKTLPFFAERFDAVDAKSIKLNDEVKKLFPKTWRDRTKAEICCAISHYRLWKQLVFDKHAKNYLILEDDVVFKPGFEKFWNDVYGNQLPKNALLVYLGGCQPWNKPHYHKVLRRHNDYFCTVKKNDYFTTGDHFWHMNANSYILSKEGAGLLCQWVDQSGMDEALDNFMQKFFNSNELFSASHRVFHLNPLMSYQLHEENDNPEIDKNSDLRFAVDKFKESENASLIFTQQNLFEEDFVRELFCDLDIIYNEQMNIVQEDSVIVYSDIFAANVDVYPAKYRKIIKENKNKRSKYFEQLKGKNCMLVHLSDEHCHADIEHYKFFKRVYRQYYREDAVADNVTFIPLGYKKGFIDE